MADNSPIFPTNGNDPSQKKNNFSAEEIRGRLNAINNYLNTNRPAILQGITQARADQDRHISQSKDYLPKVSDPITKVQNLISGDVISGPNPGPRKINESYLDYVEGLTKKARLNNSYNVDPDYYSRPTSFNSSKHGIHFDRYHSHPKFKELGINIYRDNDSRYNERSSWLDDFRRMGTKFFGLAYQGGAGMFKNWGKFGAFGEAEDAAQMESDLNVATSTKGGAGAWVTNFLANSAYTVGIVAEIGLENFALQTANVFTGGLLTPAIQARNAKTLTKLGKSITAMVDSLKKADKAKSFWTGVKGLGSSILPFQEFRSVAFNQALNPESAYNRLSDYAKMAKSFGSFYRGMREINAVTSESRLEGGFVQNKVANDALAAFIKKNNRTPTIEEARAISDKAFRAGQVAFYANVPAIYLSNKVVLDTALKGFAPIRRMMSKEGLNSNIFKTIRNYDWKKTGKKPMEVVTRGLASSTKRLFSADYLKSIPSRITGVASLKSTGKAFGGGIRYFSANLMEGLQESYQEAVQSAVSDYYLKSYYADLYSDPLLAAKNSSVASMFKGIDEQFSMQGLDVFAQGFLMGGALGPVQRVISNVGQRVSMKFSDLVNKTDQYTEYVNNEKKRLQTYADAVNSYTENPELYAYWLDENVKRQRDLAETYRYAEETGDREAAESARDESLFSHVKTLAQTDRLDGFIEQLEDFSDLSDEELVEAFGKIEGLEDQNVKSYRERIQNAIKKAKDVKKRLDTIDKKFENIYNPDLFDKEKEKEAYEEELIGYRAFEEAKAAIAFNEYSYDRVIERIASMTNKAATKGPLGDVAASDFYALYAGQDGLIRYVSTLRSEIEALKGGDKEQQTEAKKKQTQLENLSVLRVDIAEFRKALKEIDEVRLAVTDPENASPELKEKLEKLKERARLFADEMNIISSNVDPATGQMSLDFERENIDFDVIITEYLKDKIYDSYAKYAKNIADLKNVFPITSNIENSFADLIDYIKLDARARELSDHINMIADPMAIYNMSARIANARRMVKAQAKELHLKALKEYKEKIEGIDDLIQRLFGIGVYFDPDKIKNFRDNGVLPDVFIDASDGSAITPSDEKYNQIIEIIKEQEAQLGVTFSNKPVVPTTPEAKPEETKEPSVTQAPPPEDFEETEGFDVTTPIEKIPPTIKALLYEVHAAAVKEYDANPNIQEWMLDSPDAASIIAGTYKKKETKETFTEREGFVPITPENSKSIVTPTTDTAPIYNKYAAEGWTLTPDEKGYTNANKPEDQREVVKRVSDLKGSKPEDSEYLKATQARGNVIDAILRWFATPSFAFDDISPKDFILNKYNEEPTEENISIIQSELEEIIRSEMMGDVSKISKALKKNKIEVSQGFYKDLASTLLQVARATKNWTWHPALPTMVGEILGKKYGGTIDLLLEKDGEYIIVDIKTSLKSRALKPEIYEEADFLQQNAYADIFEQNTGKKIKGVYIINFVSDLSTDNKTIQNIELVTRTSKKGTETIVNDIPRKSIDEHFGYKKEEAVTPKPAEGKTKPKEPVTTTPVSDKKADIESKTKEELFPIDSLHKGKESGDTLKVIGYTKDGVRFEIQTEGTLKPTKNLILSELKRLIKEGKLTSDVYAELAALKGAKPTESKVEVISENYTPELLRANPNKLFLFGDNNTRTGKGGQAIIRDEPNAVGISTKLLPKNTPEAFMSDNQLADNKAVIDSDIKKAKEKAAKEGKTIVLPKGGFGTGLAALATKAPQTFAYLNKRLQEEFGFNNTTGELTALEAEPTTPTVTTETKPTAQKKETPNRLRGKLIYAPYGSIDPALFDEYDIINSDDIVAEVMNKRGIKAEEGKSIFQTLRNLESGLRNDIFDQIRNEINTLKKNGNTIVSSNYFLAYNADITSMPPVNKGTFMPEATSPEESVKQFEANLKANATRISEYEATQKKGWEETSGVGLKTYEKKTNKTVRELFEEGVQYSTPINEINKATTLNDLMGIMMLYETNPELRDTYVTVDVDGRERILTEQGVADMIKKKAEEIADSPESLANFNQKIDNLLDTIMGKDTKAVSEEDKKSAEDAIRKASDSASSSKASEIGERARKKSKKDIDNDFFNNLNCE